MKKKTWPIHPLLIPLFPIFAIYSANLAMVPWDHLIRPALIAVCGAAALWMILTVLYRNIEAGAVATSVVAIFFFAYSVVVHRFLLPADSTYAVVVWGFLTLLFMHLAATKLRATALLNALSIFVLLASIGQISYANSRVTTHVAESKGAAANLDLTSRPDIFYIILDGYGRSDSLKRVIGLDNSFFVQGLRDRGFYVADKATSNYCQTELSVSSSLNLDYLQTLLPEMSPKDSDRGQLQNLLNYGKAADFLEKIGYRYYGISSGFPPLRFTGADVNLKGHEGTTLFESVLMQMTPLAAREQAVASLFEERRQAIYGAFENLTSLAKPAAAPRFVITHVLCPHPPFVFGPNGEKLSVTQQYSFADGRAYYDAGGTEDEYRQRYAGQAIYVSKLALQAIDKLLAANKDRIIVIQGDHGSKLHHDHDRLDKTDIHETFEILNAYYVPAKVREKLRPDMTPVNSFRTIFQALFNAPFEQLPERSYYSPFDHPYAFTEVTKGIERDRK